VAGSYVGEAARTGRLMGHHEAPGARSLADVGARHRPHPDLRGELRGEAALGDQGHGAAGMVELMHAAHVHLGESAHHVEHLSGRADHVGGAAHAEGDRVERHQLAVTLGQLGVLVGSAGCGLRGLGAAGEYDRRRRARCRADGENDGPRDGRTT